MAKGDFKTWLAARFRPQAAAGVDVVFALAAEEATEDAAASTLATFAVDAGKLRFNPAEPADATFFFDSVETARAVLSGDADPIAAFMEGRFRADGNLPLAFVLLGLFREDYDVEAPP